MRDDLDIPFPAMSAAHAGSYGDRSGRSSGGMDANTRRLALIAGGIGGVLLAVMGGWTLMGHRHTGIPVIQADSRPVRERPVNKGGLAVEGADETILSGESEGKAVVAPAPEAPALAALKATPAASVTAISSADPAPVLRVAPLIEAPHEQLLNASRPASTPKSAPAPLVVAPAPAPVAASSKPLAPKSVAPVLAGRVQVQIAAVGSEEAAHSEWQRLAAKYPDLLGGRQSSVSRTEHDGKVFWRVRVSGFADSSGAAAFCAQMHSKGGNCAVARS
jgi:hypothetical protein